MPKPLNVDNFNRFINYLPRVNLPGLFTVAGFARSHEQVVEFRFYSPCHGRSLDTDH